MPIKKSSMSGIPTGSTEQRPSSPSIGSVYYNGTRGLLEIYTSQGWVASSAPPAVPIDVVATNQPSSRAFNNGQMSVAFSNGSGGGFISTYIITPSPATSPSTFSGSSSPITVTGLQSSTQYTYTIQANNDFGTSLTSSASAAVTATTVPQAPTIGSPSITGQSGQVSVAFTPGATGGSAITGYTATSSPGNITASGSSSPILVTGLTNGTTYTFTVTATNANGTSLASSSSAGAVPAIVPFLTAAGGYGNSGNNGGNGGSGGGSAADSSNSGGGRGGYSGSNGQGARIGTGQLGVNYGSGSNSYIPTGGSGLSSDTSVAYSGLGPNSAGSGLATYMNQENTSTRVSGYGRGCGGSEGGWPQSGSSGQDGIVAWTNTSGGSGTFSDTTSGWNPPTNSTYTFYAVGGGGGGGGGYYGPGGSGYYATSTLALTTSQSLTIVIGSGGARGGRFGNGARGGTSSVQLN